MTTALGGAGKLRVDGGMAMAATSLLPSFGSQLLQIGHLRSKSLAERFEALMRRPQETVAQAVLP